MPSLGSLTARELDALDAAGRVLRRESLRLPERHREECVGAGVLAACEAVAAWRPGGEALDNFVIGRARWAMIDELRRWAGRSESSRLARRHVSMDASTDWTDEADGERWVATLHELVADRRQDTAAAGVARARLSELSQLPPRWLAALTMDMEDAREELGCGEANVYRLRRLARERLANLATLSAEPARSRAGTLSLDRAPFSRSASSRSSRWRRAA